LAYIWKINLFSNDIEHATHKHWVSPLVSAGRTNLRESQLNFQRGLTCTYPPSLCMLSRGFWCPK
jgi:hypothetical protein